MPKSHLNIRVATPADMDAVSAMMAGSYALLADGSYDPVTLAAALPKMSRANPELLASGTYYVAEIDGRPAGCGGWTREGPGTGHIDEGVAHIRHFATHPAHLRKGIARGLLDRCLSEASAAGMRVIKSRSTLPARDFYAAAGFEALGPIEVELSPGITLPAIDMQKTL